MCGFFFPLLFCVLLIFSIFLHGALAVPSSFFFIGSWSQISGFQSFLYDCSLGLQSSNDLPHNRFHFLLSKQSAPALNFDTVFTLPMNVPSRRTWRIVSIFEHPLSPSLLPVLNVSPSRITKSGFDLVLGLFFDIEGLWGSFKDSPSYFHTCLEDKITLSFPLLLDPSGLVFTPFLICVSLFFKIPVFFGHWTSEHSHLGGSWPPPRPFFPLTPPSRVVFVVSIKFEYLYKGDNCIYCTGIFPFLSVTSLSCPLEPHSRGPSFPISHCVTSGNLPLGLFIQSPCPLSQFFTPNTPVPPPGSTFTFFFPIFHPVKLFLNVGFSIFSILLQLWRISCYISAMWQSLPLLSVSFAGLPVICINVWHILTYVTAFCIPYLCHVVPHCLWPVWNVFSLFFPYFFSFSLWHSAMSLFFVSPSCWERHLGPFTSGDVQFRCGPFLLLFHLACPPGPILLYPIVRCPHILGDSTHWCSFILL